MRAAPYVATAFAMVCLAVSSLSRAGSYEDGQAAARRGDYRAAVALWIPLADAGHADAQYNLGVTYLLGLGMPSEPVVGAQWLRQAADQGHPQAQFNLGRLYVDGLGVPKDAAIAADWYRKAADQGISRAQYNLGSLYSQGRGVTQSYAEAARWHRLAANQGIPEAQFDLGVAYARGEGMPLNLVDGLMWFEIALRFAAAAERPIREDVERARDLVAARLTPAEIEEAKRRAREWRPSIPARQR